MPSIRATAAAPAAASGVFLGVRAALSTEIVSLAVKGRSNTNPWVAATGAYVVVAWGAVSDGHTDVFVAVSRDSGQTFGPPVQVNTVPGEARLGGELPPRVALVPATGSGEPEITVRGWVGHRRVSRRWPSHGRRSRGHGPPGVADGHRRRES